MTREEAIKLLTQYIDYDSETPDYYEMEKACKLAIKALEQEPFMNKPCISSKVCEHDKEVVLDKIRAEILEYIDDLDTAKEICDIFDKYKAESEE